MPQRDPYIAVRKRLLRDGRVRELSRKCHRSVTEVFGSLVTIWLLADDYAEAETGRMAGYTTTDIDDEVGIKGFCEAMPECWLVVRNGEVYLPKYQEHNGTTAKARIEAACRQRRHRDDTDQKDDAGPPVTELSRKTCDKTVTRGDERKGDERRGDDIRSSTSTSGDHGNLWEEVWERAQRERTKLVLPARKPADKSLLLKACYLVHAGLMPEHWLVDSIAAVRATTQKKPWAFFYACLKNKAADFGKNFGQLMAPVRVPEDIMARDLESD